MKPEIKKWVQKRPSESQKGTPPKKTKTLKEGVHPTSTRKYEGMETRTTGTTGGGRKQKGNIKLTEESWIS